MKFNIIPQRPPAPDFVERKELLARLEKLDAERDKEMIDDIYDLTLKQLANEDAHSGRLDARAAALFGVVGFSMTVAFSFGGWALLDNARKVPGGTFISIAFVVVLLLGLITSGFAWAGLKLNEGHYFPDENDIWNETVVWPERGRAGYRKYVAVHLWGVYQQRHATNEKRAWLIYWGQLLFMGFLLSVLVLSGITTTSAIVRAPDPVPPVPAVSVTIVAPSLVPNAGSTYPSSSVGVVDGGAPSQATTAAPTIGTANAADEAGSSTAASLADSGPG